METLKLIATIIGTGVLCAFAALMLAFILVSIYAFLTNLFSTDSEKYMADYEPENQKREADKRNPYRVGDIVEIITGPVKIKSIQYYQHAGSPQLECAFNSEPLTKDLTPLGTGRQLVLQSEIITKLNLFTNEN